MAQTSSRGFASMDPEKQKEIARKGGRAAHAKGTAHEFTSDEARSAGRKGGEAVSRNRAHMAEIGRRGGERRGARRAAQREQQGGNGASASSSRNETRTDTATSQVPVEERSSQSAGRVPPRAFNERSDREWEMRRERDRE